MRRAAVALLLALPGVAAAAPAPLHGVIFLIRTASDIAIVTDRNVHDRLVRLAGSLYADWGTRRRPGSDTVSVTLGGMPVALGADGSFDVTIPAPAAQAARVASTAAGESTEVEVR